MSYRNPEQAKAYQKEYAQRNKDKAREKVKEWRKANPEALAEQRARYKAKHPEKALERTLRWKWKNIDKVRAKDRENQAAYRRANNEKVVAAKRKYAINNKGVINAAVAKREAAKKQRTPNWLSPTDLWMIQEIYTLASLRSDYTGISWHVDHIIPLQGENVSGLHIPINLQVIPAVENIKKSNIYEVSHVS
jgi:hypothetical protein